MGAARRHNLQSVYTVVELTHMAGLMTGTGIPDYLRTRRYLRSLGVILDRRGKNLVCYLSDLKMKAPMFWDSLVERAAYAHLLE